MEVPGYLAAPSAAHRAYGRLRFEPSRGGGLYIVEAEPAALEMAKRVFPGCSAGAVAGTVRFPATRRLAGELCWFLQRFPLTIECADRFAADRQRAIEHAERRELVRGGVALDAKPVGNVARNDRCPAP